MHSINANPAVDGNNSRYAFLDLLRIFAFVSVLIGHEFYSDLDAVSTDPTVHATIRLLAGFLLPLTNGGGAGVVVFFLISGYIISHVLQRETAGVFLIKRVFRIYPLYMFAVIAEIVMAKVVHGAPIPELSVLVPRLLLLGDFFSLPYALSEVEWTLRIEVCFYVLAAAARFVRPLDLSSALLVLYCAVIFALQWFGPFPRNLPLFVGYITLYMPFLFAGSCIYLFEKNIQKTLCVVLILYIIGSYLILLPKINPYFMNSNFAIYAMVIFLFAWKRRASLKSVAVVTLFAELTYSVYLFHKWSWDHIDRFFVNSRPGVFLDKLKITLVLLVICALVYMLVERPFIRLGARLSVRYGRAGSIKADRAGNVQAAGVTHGSKEGGSP